MLNIARCRAGRGFLNDVQNINSNCLSDVARRRQVGAQTFFQEKWKAKKKKKITKTRKHPFSGSVVKVGYVLPYVKYKRTDALSLWHQQ